MGLLFLRFSVVIALLLEGYRQGLPGWAQGATRLLAVALFAGYMTPIAAAIGLLLHGLIWLKLGAGSPAVAIVVCLDIISLALLGPGGYSADAFRFGRRVVVVPPR